MLRPWSRYLVYAADRRFRRQAGPAPSVAGSLPGTSASSSGRPPRRALSLAAEPADGGYLVRMLGHSVPAFRGRAASTTCRHRTRDSRSLLPITPIERRLCRRQLPRAKPRKECDRSASSFVVQFGREPRASLRTAPPCCRCTSTRAAARDGPEHRVARRYELEQQRSAPQLQPVSRSARAVRLPSRAGGAPPRASSH